MSGRPSEAILWDFLRGAMMARALGIVAELGVAQKLAEGPRSVDELADGVDPEALYRVLRALASDGVFAEREPRIFENTAASEMLAGEAWTSFAHLFGGVFYRAIGDLDAAVREGRGTFADTFGTDFWPWLAAHPDERVEFDRAMAGRHEPNAERLAALDWRDDEIVVDLGGGNGTLLIELLRRKPDLRGIVFDLPETTRDESSFPAGLDFVEGSFFDSVPQADTYLTSGILHDWDDERAGQILQSVRAAARPGARLLLLENVVDDGNEPQGAKWLDLLMLVIQGRERTEHEWRELLEANAFDAVAIEDGLIEARCR